VLLGRSFGIAVAQRGLYEHKKEALLAESLDWVDSTCFRLLALEQANERLLAGVRLSEHRRSSRLRFGWQ
jgi:hypothetical protein